MVNIMNVLENRIRSARQAQGISAAELAKSVGVTSAAVSRWETGQVKNLRMEHLFSIARVLDVNPEWLATGRGGRQKHPYGVQEEPASYDTLNHEEQLWLNLYRSLPIASREQIKTAVKKWLDEIE